MFTLAARVNTVVERSTTDSRSVKTPIITEKSLIMSLVYSFSSFLFLFFFFFFIPLSVKFLPLFAPFLPRPPFPSFSPFISFFFQAFSFTVVAFFRDVNYAKDSHDSRMPPQDHGLRSCQPTTFLIILFPNIFIVLDFHVSLFYLLSLLPLSL